MAAVARATGPGNRPGVPLAERRFRHPVTLQEAVLGVYLVQRPGGAFHQVRVERPGDQDAVPGIMWCTEVRFRDQARRVWLARARELRSLGYERV